MNCFYSRSKQFLLKSFFLLTLISTTVSFGFSQADGAKLFKVNCSRCHSVGEDIITGPGLKGITERVPAPADEWLHKWIKNNKALQKSGDAYANKVYGQFKKDMDVFDGVLTDDEITAVIAYIKAPPAPTGPTGHTGETGTKKPVEPGIDLTLILGISAIVLLILVNVLGAVKKHLQDSVNAKNGLPPSEKQGMYGWLRHHKRMTALIGILFTIVLVRVIYIGVMNIGVYETYKPEQPIKFSHRIHAGKLSINCVYCHSGAEKGKTAGVPSANVCMNCHKAIKEGPETGKEEIAKIYEAVGWDPVKAEYDETKQHPIKWNRVHALPDFAYFNHSQHVVVGKQDCKNCHGDLTKMNEAEQVSPLTMNWCIECHRKTEVPGMASNPYYEELHKKLKEKYGKEPITVEKMGGLDCIKCHY